ncbi:AAA family ATPase [Bermanella sp. WJH001]|uniref:AAA family ATPase n=1 Tax=Bermanella sp. WJH001 TaxID=3048005 RepID=UPI0024BE9837|nr:AAA family ATPase [Bermanella sp. WJH001]MDJ1536729.1 shikimate kinase [Bermanella sp. WJH001]
MKRIVIFGNSGSGKSTLAKHLSLTHQLSHLDLDTLAWQDTQPPSRKPLSESLTTIEAFIDQHPCWVIEGCYSDLIEPILTSCNEVFFMDLPTQSCIENAKSRPWEPHKYDSKEAQDANLKMLVDWIAQYDTRDDNFSKKAHQSLFDHFRGTKHLYKENPTLKTQDQ